MRISSRQPALLILWLCAAILFGIPCAQADHATPQRVQSRPGARVAWLTVGRERVQEHVETRRAAGLSVAGPDGTVEIDPVVTNEDRRRVTLVDVETGSTSRIPAAPRSNAEKLQLTAIAGASQVVVAAGEVQILYARKNVHAWTYHAHDGGSLDADGTPNGTITIPLAVLQSLQGHIPPPASVDRGDIVVALEPRTLRSTEVVVE